MHTSVGPVAGPDRIDALDVLRGFALLGILVPNIQAYSMVSAAYRNPLAYGDFTGANFLVWYSTYLLFESKFMTIFSALFGAGIILMTDRAKSAGRSPIWLHTRRMFWLLIFGALHAHLIWFGDILVLYAVTGMLVIWLRGLKPIWLTILGLLLLGIGWSVFQFLGVVMQFAPPEAMADIQRDWLPPPTAIEEELTAYRGSWLDQMPWRSSTALVFETFLFALMFVWRIGGLMLIGMALFKWQVLTGLRSPRLYVTAASIGLPIGIALVAWEAHVNLSKDFSVEYSFFFGAQINYWASLLISFAYVSIIMLICQSRGALCLKSKLAAVGRMALTNYILHSVICTWIFYGHGLGYFGHLQRIEQIGVVVAIWLFQIIASELWLRIFRFGPLEWTWRSLVYWRRQPIWN